MSDAEKKKYIIGIDLGTTNCTLAYAPLPDAPLNPATSLPEIQPFSVSQLIERGSMGESLQLPSFLYFPLQEEKEGEAMGVSWDPSRAFVVGQFAKNRGEELPDRLISSAKSWLSHQGVDRRAALLPESMPKEERLSPVTACCQYLTHLKETWNQAHPESPFEDQQVFVTVPASFDPSARELAQEAAELAGYPKVTWLEEPQAAFYSWLYRHQDTWREQVSVGDSVLVVDVGGGTTDFSLIEVKEAEGDLVLERVAVGDHLLLGGDNMDLAAAYLARQQFEADGVHLDDWQFKSLTHLARRAKETLLSQDGPESLDLTIQGRGSSLIGGSLTTQLQRDALLALLVDGFFPMVPEEEPVHKAQVGLQSIGLPYATDPRVSCQLAAFLSRSSSFPRHVLFNGGVFQADAFCERLIDLLNSWAEARGLGTVQALPDPDYNAAVGQGAAYYGLAREGGAVRIKGGTSRSYFIGVEDAVPAVPGIPRSLTALCVVPFGMEEGSEAILADKEFTLLLGQKVTFRFFSCPTADLPDGRQAEVGTALRNWGATLSELSPVEATLDTEGEEPSTVRVHLRSCVTELGVLELWCESDDDRRWKLEFSVREEPQPVAVSH